MKNQMMLDLTSIERVKTKEQLRKEWRIKFQEYCDKMQAKYGEQNGTCTCGCENYCDACEMREPTPCSYAMLYYKNYKIDYNKTSETDFEKLLKE